MTQENHREPRLFILIDTTVAYLEGVRGRGTLEPEDQWSCKRSPDILA